MQHFKFVVSFFDVTNRSLILNFRNVNDDTVVIGNPVRHRYEPPARLLPPPGVEDFDKECGNDPNVCSEYANDIFNYYKSREVRILNRTTFKNHIGTYYEKVQKIQILFEK